MELTRSGGAGAWVLSRRVILWSTEGVEMLLTPSLAERLFLSEERRDGMTAADGSPGGRWNETD